MTLPMYFLWRVVNPYNNATFMHICFVILLTSLVHANSMIQNTKTWLVHCFNSRLFSCHRRINMAGLSTRTVPHLADAIHAAVTCIP